MLIPLKGLKGEMTCSHLTADPLYLWDSFYAKNTFLCTGMEYLRHVLCSRIEGVIIIGMVLKTKVSSASKTYPVL